MTLTRTTTVALAFLVAAGCGGGGGDLLSDSAGSRRRMPSCGSYTATESPLPAQDEAVRQCFLNAAGDGTQMEVTVTVESMEGDPITTIYRVLGPDDLELFVDASADKFSPVKTYHQRCTSVAAEGNGLAAGGCVTLA
ncbi:MAG: hypothetical protein QOG43_2351 [Actinomycetota bacterium]|nr:hypothetical protein [Actinomycetota bacterium]